MIFSKSIKLIFSIVNFISRFLKLEKTVIEFSLNLMRNCVSFLNFIKKTIEKTKKTRGNRDIQMLLKYGPITAIIIPGIINIILRFLKIFDLFVKL